MKKWLFAAVMASILLLTACGAKGADSNNSGGNGDNDKLQVIASFTILKDMAEQIGGEHIDVHNLVPTGTDPHEYEPLPEDTKKATDADLLLYNGLNLEGGKKGWFFKMIDSVGQDEDNVFAASEGVDPMYIGGGEHEKEKNPHDFIDPGIGIQMAKNIKNALIEVDPDHKDEYEEQGEKYIDRLKEIEKEYDQKMSDIPDENRILVTSERAYQYLADHYDLKEGFVFEVDTEENGTPKQIKNLVSFIEDHQPPVLFVESNVDERPMETVSEESGVPIYDKQIYSDEIGEEGEEVDTYVKYLNYNLKVLHNGLSE